jgi:glycosyltransferase involved in cell wall biosynthesis
VEAALSGPHAVRPRVTVGIPVYNGERFLAQAIDSILGQSFADLEVVLSDNASTDGTPEICCRYAASDARVRYTRNPTNLGVARNYSLLAQRARGEYFKWCSANDLCAPDFIGRCVEILDRHPDVALCYPRTRLIEFDSSAGEDYVDGVHLMEASPSSRWWRLVRTLRLNNALNGVFRLAVLRQTSLHGDYPGADLNLMAEVALRGKFYEIPEALFYRRVLPGTITKTMDGGTLSGYFGAHGYSAWRQNAAYLRAALRAPIPARERLAVCRHLLRKVYWDRARLGAELASNVRSLFRARGNEVANRRH